MDPTDDSDRRLVLAAQNGDRGAFARLLDRHWSLLRALCRRSLGEPPLVEDAMQEAALQAMLNLDRLRDPDRFGAWLGGIGLNVCRRWRRYRSEDAWSWEALLGGQLRHEPADWRPGPAELIEAADLRERVRQAVAGLPRGQRAAVLLFYLEGLPHAETALLLGIEVGAVKTRLHKARRTLRERLSTLWKEETMATETETGLVEMRVADVRRRPASGNHHMVILEEIGGERRLEIWVGRFEGEAIAVLLQGVEFTRPLTYAFMASVLQAGGARVREARVSKLVEDVFYATVLVEGAGATAAAEVDARPSDALSLALVTGAPIRVAVAVLDAAPAREPSEDEIRALIEQHNLSDEKAREMATLRRGFFADDAEGAAEIAAAVKGSSPGAGAAPKQAAP